MISNQLQLNEKTNLSPEAHFAYSWLFFTLFFAPFAYSWLFFTFFFAPHLTSPGSLRMSYPFSGLIFFFFFFFFGGRGGRGGGREGGITDGRLKCANTSFSTKESQERFTC